MERVERLQRHYKQRGTSSTSLQTVLLVVTLVVVAMCLRESDQKSMYLFLHFAKRTCVCVSFCAYICVCVVCVVCMYVCMCCVYVCMYVLCLRSFVCVYVLCVCACVCLCGCKYACAPGRV